MNLHAGKLSKPSHYCLKVLPGLRGGELEDEKARAIKKPCLPLPSKPSKMNSPLGTFKRVLGNMLNSICGIPK
jgi:hypothetical protein